MSQIHGHPGPSLSLPRPPSALAALDDSPEVSFVLPCLNEAATLAACIAQIRELIARERLDAEIVVADNGSTDGSPEAARAGGARVVVEPERGYGRTLLAGLAAARGRYVVMGDSDLSYDFAESFGMIERLRAGAELVLGSRLPSGGGRIHPGAMPWLHRWVGNPLLSGLGRRMFRCRVTDFHCGLRAMRRGVVMGLGMRAPGMEFATEMVVRAALAGVRISEVPVTLRKDGRDRPSHLRRWRDGWRHVRFMLGLCPLWTLVYPGLSLLVLGLCLGSAVAFGSVRFAGVSLDIHTLVASSLLVLVGYQSVTAGAALSVYARGERLTRPEDGRGGGATGWVVRLLSIERGIALGGVAGVVGLGLIGWVVRSWGEAGFGALEVGKTLRPMIVGATMVGVGVQTVLMAFVCSTLGLKAGGAGLGMREG